MEWKGGFEIKEREEAGVYEAFHVLFVSWTVRSYVSGKQIPRRRILRPCIFSGDNGDAVRDLHSTKRNDHLVVVAE